MERVQPDKTSIEVLSGELSPPIEAGTPAYPIEPKIDNANIPLTDSVSRNSSTEIPPESPSKPKRSRKKSKPKELAPNSGDHFHRWILTSPNGPTSIGICDCGEEKEFPNSISDELIGHGSSTIGGGNTPANRRKYFRI